MAAGEAAHSVDFCTLGMFIIDEIHFPAPKPPVNNILGGAGSYSALGARIFSPTPSSKTVGWIIDCGSDFPAKLRDVISSWDTSCLIRETPERLTTRGWNHYGENEYRGKATTAMHKEWKLQIAVWLMFFRQAFKYLTPKLRLDADSLTTQLLASRSFHLICSPTRCADLVDSILTRRKLELELDIIKDRPLFIWEPVPDLCTPEELEKCYEALRLVDVVSPNHQELASFLGETEELYLQGKLKQTLVESMCRKWLESGVGVGGEGSVVIRCGASGCFYAKLDARRKLERGWLPAYHHDKSRVVDPTGGGNTFLGGFAVGLVRTQSVREATIWGNIAASFAIEQVGIPELFKQGGSKELWNGIWPEVRLVEYKERLHE